MTSHYRTQGFVLKQEDLREADQLFTVYTKDFGKLKILGRAIRKMGAKLKGGLQLLRLAEVEFIQGKNYKTLTDVFVIQDFSSIKKELKKLKAAHQISDVVDSMIKGEEQDTAIWQLLSAVLEELNASRFTVHDLQLVYYFFFWKLISLLGYEPQLNNCVVCHKKLEPEGLSFYPEEGGIICADCFEKDKKEDSVWIGADTVKALRFILKNDWTIIKKMKINKSVFENLKQVSDIYLDFILNLVT